MPKAAGRADGACCAQAEPGQKIVFERVLLTKNANESLNVGAPYVSGAHRRWAAAAAILHVEFARAVRSGTQNAHSSTLRRPSNELVLWLQALRCTPRCLSTTALTRSSSSR